MVDLKTNVGAYALLAKAIFAEVRDQVEAWGKVFASLPSYLVFKLRKR